MRAIFWLAALDFAHRPPHLITRARSARTFWRSIRSGAAVAEGERISASAARGGTSNARHTNSARNITRNNWKHRRSCILVDSLVETEQSCEWGYQNGSRALGGGSFGDVSECRHRDIKSIVAKQVFMCEQESAQLEVRIHLVAAKSNRPNRLQMLAVVCDAYSHIGHLSSLCVTTVCSCIYRGQG